MKKVVVGLSGGVDSSVALLLLKNQGYAPIGVFLKLPVWKDEQNKPLENSCCTKESLDVARSVCKKLNVPFYVYDVQKDFQKKVVDYFVSSLKKEKTPNPCAVCNRHLKFKKLFTFAKSKNITLVATGHYAKIKKQGKVSLLLRPKDLSKDQTYGLCFLSKKQINNILFPLGDLLKTQVKDIAKQERFDVFQKKKESQDFCFVSNKRLPSFIESQVGVSYGSIYNKNKKIGAHKGSCFFTIGQRKGLGLSKKYFVLKKNNNKLFVTDDQKKLYKKKFLVNDCNFLIKDFFSKKEYFVKIRYSQKLVKANINKKNNYLEVTLKKPHKSITPGQVCAFYDNNQCVGGGFIL